MFLGFEVAVDGNEDILVETGITTRAGFGVKAASEDTEIMLEETKSPFEGYGGVVMFEGMSTTLGLFDKLAIGYTSCRPGLGKMVGIELNKAVMFGSHASYDMFVVFATFFEGVDFSAISGIHADETEIAHTTSARSGFGRKRDVTANDGR